MRNGNEKDAARVRIVPPLAPLATVLIGVGLQELWPIGPGFAVPGWVHYAIGALILAGAFFGFGVWAVVIMRRTGQTENPFKPTTEIVERGPFRITRNPMYLQMVIGCIGFAVLLWNLWILVLTPLCWIALHYLAVLPEEAYLEGKFGDAYREYKTRVRRWI